MTSLIFLIILSSEGQAEVPMNNCAYQINQYIQFLVFYYGSHIVRKFDIRLPRLSFWMTVCERQHIISGSFNHFIEYGRWGSAHIDSLSIPAIQRNDFVVQIILRGATRTWNLWRIDREFQRHTDWNLQFIHDRLDVYVPNHIFSTTLARIHRRQSFIFYASHAAEHNMTMEITTNEWTSSAAAIFICN